MSHRSKKSQPSGVTHPKRANFICELDEDAVTVENNGRLYELSMDARSFTPEEVKIKVTATHVTIDAMHETEDEVTECNEEIVLPEDVLPETVEVLMNSNGVLRIRAPIQQKEVDLPCIITKESVTRTEITEKKKTSTKVMTSIEENSDEEKNVEPQVMDPSTEARILQDRKYVDSTKDIVPKNGKLEMNIDLRGHKEENIKVSVSKRIVAIQAVDKENRAKEIHRRFLIPDGVDPGSFKTLLKKGVLTVSMDDPKAAPKKAPVAPTAKAAPPPVKEPPKPEPPVQLPSKVVEPKEVEALERRCEDITRQVVKIEKNKKFEAKLNVSGFNAEELRVKITKKVIIVHTETKTTMRQFSKKITLPAGVRPESITNSLTPEDGILTITAPIVEEPPTPTENVDVKPQMDLANTSTRTESHFEDISRLIQPGKFEVEVDVSDYKPEEIDIKILKSIVTIKGTQTMQHDQKSSSRQFFKKFQIPQGVKPESIKCTFTNTGTLKVYSVEQTPTQVAPPPQLSTSGSTIKPEIIGSGLGSTSGQIMSGDSVKFERKVDAAGYKEDEIKVTISNGWITVIGKQQMGPELNFQTRQFTKKFSVPYGVKPDSISVNLQPNGTLILSAGN